MQSMSSFSLFVQGRKLLQDSEESQSSAPMTDQGSPDFTNAGFTSSLLVVTGSLFLSILCVLVFNALFRCILLYRRWRTLSEASPNMDVQRAQSGIEKKDLEALPATVYHTEHPLRALDCPICLAEFMGGEKLRVLPECCHSFHADCTETWLVSNASCPTCRNSLLCALSKKPTEESALMDVRERKSVAANDVQIFQISGDYSTASSSLASLKSASDLESGNTVGTTKA